MDAYNRARLMMGFPVEFEHGRSTAELTEKRSKQLLARAKSLLVQLICLDENGTRVGALNGTFYLGGGQEPLVLTTAHVLGWGGAVKYVAAFTSEDNVPHTVDLELCKSGPINPNLVATAPQANEYSPDLAVFRCKVDVHDMPQLAPPLPPTVPTVGDITYIAAYEGVDRVLSFTDGIVSSASLDKYTTTAYADSGYSGAPVIDMRGFLLGIVLRGFGVTIQQVSFVPANIIHAFLQSGQPQLPGLPTA